jgi:peptidylprolyl isomerase
VKIMSDGVKSRPADSGESGSRSPRPPAKRQSPRAQRRAELKRAAEEAARRQKRRQAIIGVLGAFVGVAAIVGLIYWLAGPDDGSPSAGASTAPSVKCAPTDAQPQQIPAGMDEALKTKPKVCGSNETVTALKKTVLVEGTGAEVKSGQTVTVNYVGVTLKTGEEFDASWKRGQPYDAPIGVGQVIKGWDQGIVGVKVGSRVQLDIPGSLAYGDQPDPQRPYGTLRFVVDVLGVKDGA